ncbi:hypothetical protein E2C01_070744 [Portunus trituberculatus]|uniref:Uncharacterized protein n=1 Tax=Portunus trituberculatus TaxID=210409 RepID=A0A5B7I699_PORTR|nr:hypothetical protein [Portunus trituberculatus]
MYSHDVTMLLLHTHYCARHITLLSFRMHLHFIQGTQPLMRDPGQHITFKVFKRLQMSISLAAFVFKRDFPVRVSDIQR